MIKKPWGYYEILIKKSYYIKKKIVIFKKEETSLQYHKKRKEIFIVKSGKGLLIAGNNKNNLFKIELKKGYKFFIDKNFIHQIINNSNKKLIILEYQFGKKIDEKDIIRLKDKYNRI